MAEKIPFYHAFNKPKSVPINPGNKTEVTYSQAYKVNGTPYLEKIVEVDNYNMVKADRDQCDLNKLITRVTQSGDSSLLNRGNPQYINLIGVGSDLASIYDSVRKAEAEFNSLPLDIRGKFGYDFKTYISSFGSDFFNSVFSSDSSISDNNAIGNNKTSEVKE